MRTILTALFLLLASTAFADDEVKLKNGDRITGKITGLAGGKLVVETKAEGKVSIDWTQVLSVKSDDPLRLKLLNGDLVEGKASPSAEGKIKIDATDIEMAQVAKINEPAVQWHGNLNLAAKGTDGNTLTKSFLVAAEGSLESESDVILLRGLFRYGQQNGLLSERNAYLLGKYQYKFNPTFYAYASEEFLSDTFKDIGAQSITSVGVGFEIIKESWVDLSAEVGIAYITTDFQAAIDESHIGARLAARGRLALPLGFEAKDTVIVYPNFKYGPNFQVRNEFTLGTSLGGGWNLLGGIITEFNNRPSPGLNNTDNTYFLGIGFSF